MFFIEYELVFPDESVEVAPYEIAHHDGGVECEHAESVFAEVVHWHAEVIECVGYAVGESAHDEQRHTKEQWQILALTGEGYGCGHDKSAPYSQHATFQRTCGKAAFKNLLRRVLQVYGAASGYQRHEQAANDVAHQYEQQLPGFSFFDKSGGAGVEFQTVVHNGKQTECEKHGSHDSFLVGKVAETSNADANASQNRGAKNLFDFHARKIM